MVLVLEHGSKVIHSDNDFRDEYAKVFPGCVRGSLSDGCMLTNPNDRSEIRIALVGQIGSTPELTPATRPSPPDPIEQRKQMVSAIDARERSISALKKQQLSTSGLRSFALRAAVEEGTLVLQRQRDELAEFDRGGPPERYVQVAYAARRLRNEFVAQRKAIQIRALQDALPVVSPEQRIEINRRLLLLQESRIDDGSLQSMISLPALIGDDMIALTAPAPAHAGWLLWIAFVLSLVITALLIAIYRSKRV